MARQSSRNKSVPQNRKAEISKSDNDYIFPEAVDNANVNDLPNDNVAAEESKEEERYEAENIAQGPKKKPASDSDDGSRNSSGLGDDGKGVGGNSVSGGRRSRAPDQGLIHSSANTIIRLLTRLGTENNCAIRMINVEQFQNENNPVKLDDNCIHSICTVNRRNKKDVETYVSCTGEYKLQLAGFSTKHLKFTGHSFHPDKIIKSLVMTFKYHKKPVETHVSSEVTLSVITNIMMEKEPDNVWELLDKNLNTARDNNGVPLYSWCR